MKALNRTSPCVYPSGHLLPQMTDEIELTGSGWTSLSVRGVDLASGMLARLSEMAGLRKSLRKEVIQPQVLLRLPCYDLVPVTELAVGTTESWRLRALPASMT